MNLTKPAKYISYLFIPPTMNLIIFTIYSFFYEPVPKSYYGIVISFFFGLLLPLIAIFEFRRKGVISDNNATIKEERWLPYIFAIGFSLSGVVFSSLTGLNEKIIMLWMVYLVNSILIININRFWKISAHAVGAAIPLGALTLIGDFIPLFILALIFIFVCSSRIILKVHTFMQVIAGAVSGFIVSFVLLNYCL